MMTAATAAAAEAAAATDKQITDKNVGTATVKRSAAPDIFFDVEFLIKNPEDADDGGAKNSCVLALCNVEWPCTLRSVCQSSVSNTKG